MSKVKTCAKKVPAEDESVQNLAMKIVLSSFNVETLFKYMSDLAGKRRNATGLELSQNTDNTAEKSVVEMNEITCRKCNPCTIPTKIEIFKSQVT